MAVHKDTPLLERLMLKHEVNPDNGCWEWTGYKDKDGYGSLYMKRKGILAHRAIFKLFIGYLPDNLFVCHKCDNPSCINPFHLFRGTHQENMDDAYIVKLSG